MTAYVCKHNMCCEKKVVEEIIPVAVKETWNRENTKVGEVRFFLHTRQGFLWFSPVLDISILYMGCKMTLMPVSKDIGQRQDKTCIILCIELFSYALSHIKTDSWPTWFFLCWSADKHNVLCWSADNLYHSVHWTLQLCLSHIKTDSWPTWFFYVDRPTNTMFYVDRPTICIILCIELFSYAWVTLKLTVSRPDFFMLIGRQTRFWWPTGAVTLKTYLTDYLHWPQSFPFGRPSPDDRSTVGWLHFLIRQHATSRPVGDCQLTDHMTFWRPCACDRQPIVGRRSPDAEPITKTRKSSGDQKKIITA